MSEKEIARRRTTRMILLGRKSAREKIATFLDLLARRGALNGDVGQISLELPMTRDQIANFLGLTLETVSRQMNVLKREGLISFSGRKQVDVIDLIALRHAAGDDTDGGMIV